MGRVTLSLIDVQKYHPYEKDPNLSGALASVLWELNLLSKHYHPAISLLASNISSMSVANNQVYLSNISPIQAFTDMSLERETFDPPSGINKSNNKRKRGIGSSISASVETSGETSSIDEDELRKKLSAHFMLLRDIKENKKLRSELEHVTSSLQQHKEYKQQKRKTTQRPKSKKKLV